MDRTATRGRDVFTWVGAVALVVAVAAFAVAGVLSLRAADDGPPAPVTPRLARSVTLRAEPDERSSAVARLDRGVPLVLRGRSQDGSWLVVELLGRIDVFGWVPRDAVQYAGEVERVAVVGEQVPPRATSPSPATPTVAAQATQTPDLPDLAIEDVYSSENRLAVMVANLGAGDVSGAVFVSVGGGEARRVDVGKPLRSGDTLEAVLEDEYVQRRASVLVEVRPAEGVEEEDTENNRFEALVEPDLPTDIEVLEVTLSPADGHLVVTVRNNSQIPLVGTVTLVARETDPAPRLLDRIVEPLSIDAGGVNEFDFPQLTGLDLARVQVLLSTSAINDTDRENDVFPR